MPGPPARGTLNCSVTEPGPQREAPGRVRHDGPVASSRRRAVTGVACALAAVAPSVTACSPSSGPGVLRAEVGEPGDPDAYTMSLVDAEGERVETLPAGRYDVVVSDHSAIHNLHLRGPGVEESTGVTSSGTTTWSVTLRPGEHTYVCDPHPGMTARFSVT